MRSQTPELQAVLERLEKLERQNRKLKRAGALALATVAAVVLMGQAVPKSHIVEAEEFVARDSSGKIQATLNANGLMFTAGNAKFTLLNRSGLVVSDEDGNFAIELQAYKNGLHLNNSRLESVHGTFGPYLKLTDYQGFQSLLGVAELETAGTGESHKTSASSLVMFDKGQRVIWRAP
ncbi:MAG TPA: hypothetical protein VKV95_14405 [Terriglobia bacterium]|nr:hypothetical protein [Terriglobia bacterium]